jgi:hypothetical protein
MSGHEARINDALKQLAEEFRLGMVAADEYRLRRKMLLESWGEKDTTTSPRASRTQQPTARPSVPGRAGASAAVAPPPRKNKGILVAAIVAVVIAGAIASYFVLVPRRTPAESPAGSGASPASPQVLAILKAADDFLARNAWDVEPINAFLGQWRALSADERSRARQEPSLRTLRYELGQNIQAESQLVPADAPPDQRRRLDLLNQFARDLDGSTQ